jgi:uncharacterized protein (DUF1697 family)
MTAPPDGPGRRYVALLRGVNVGGKGRLAMADLRAVLAELGFRGISTLLQSGNAAFTAAGDSAPTDLAIAIAGGLLSECGLATRVVIRTPAEIQAVIAANPFPEAVSAPKTLHVAFLEEDVDPVRLAALPADRYVPDEIRNGDRVLYLHLPNGAGRSRLALEFERKLGIVGTARNWNTVTGLLVLAGDEDRAG